MPVIKIQSMKKLIPFALSAILASTLLLSGCAKEDEPQPDDPTADPRAKFHGHWHAAENSSAYGTSSYYVDITDSTNASFILFSYLSGYHTKIHATVSSNSLTIPSQIVEGNNVSGSGTLTNSNQINLNYLIWLGGSNYDTVKSTLTK
jgi:hypothetical protein